MPPSLGPSGDVGEDLDAVLEGLMPLPCSPLEASRRQESGPKRVGRRFQKMEEEEDDDVELVPRPAPRTSDRARRHDDVRPARHPTPATRYSSSADELEEAPSRVAPRPPAWASRALCAAACCVCVCVCVLCLTAAVAIVGSLGLKFR